MSVVAAQLVTEVKAEGIGDAKSQLSGMGSFVDAIGAGFKNALGGALSLASHLAADGLSFLKDQLIDSIKVAEDHQLAMAQTVQALKSTHDASGMTADAIDNLAVSFSQMTPFSADTVQQGENLLLTFTGIGKQVFPETTQAMLDMAQAMHQGPEQGAIMLGKALNDPKTGLTALTRVGVTFSDQEKKQIQTMMAHNDIIGAQKIMLHELETEFGGSAKAAGQTFAGQVAILKNNFEDLKVKIGTDILPILSSFLGIISKEGMPILDAFGKWFTGAGGKDITMVMSQIGGLGQAAFKDMNFGGLTSGLSGLGSTVQDAFVGIQKGLSTVNPADVAGALSQIFGILGSGLDILKSTSGFFLDLGEHLFETASKSGLLHDILTTLSDVMSTADSTIQTLTGDAQIFADGILNALTQSGFFHDTLSAIKDILPDVSTFLTNVGDDINTNVLPPLESLITNVGSAIGGFMTWADKSGAAKQTLQGLSGVIGTTSQVLGTLVGWAGNLVGFLSQDNPLADTFKGILLGIGGVIAGIKIVDFGKNVYSTMLDAKNNVQSFIGKLGDIKKTVLDVVGFFKDKFSGGVGDSMKSVEGDAAAAGTSVEAIGTDAETASVEVTAASTTMEGDMGAVAGSAEVAGTAEATIGTAASTATPIVGGLATAVGGLWAIAGVVGFAALAEELNIAWGIFSGKAPPVKYTPNYKGPHGFASGTDFAPGGLSVIGERGPELMYVPRGAQIIPNHQLGGVGMGGQIVVNTPIYLDGRLLSNGMLPYLANAIRYSTGGMGR